MKRVLRLAGLMSVLWLAQRVAWADGGFFYPMDSPGALAQTRQEVLMALYAGQSDAAPRVTYVLRSRYTGQPAALAWVVPVPATPTGVVAHATGQLFEWLDSMTAPVVISQIPTQVTGGCGCAGVNAGGGTPTPALVNVEASGTAGIFEWAALTSTGSDALLAWLNDNGFAVPGDAASILDGYIEEDMHFLAIRVAVPEQVAANAAGETEIPPIQFTCQTDRRFYPMAISHISAAEEADVLIYVLAAHRAEADNVPNAVIDPTQVTLDRTTGKSNYAALFAETLAAAGGLAFITEAVFPQFQTPGSNESTWPAVPPEVAMQTLCLTRLRTVLQRDQMTIDFEFRDAATDEAVSNEFWIPGTAAGTSAAGLAGPPAAAAVLYAVFRALWTRRRRWARRRVRTTPSL